MGKSKTNQTKKTSPPSSSIAERMKRNRRRGRHGRQARIASIIEESRNRKKKSKKKIYNNKPRKFKRNANKKNTKSGGVDVNMEMDESAHQQQNKVNIYCMKANSQ